MGRPKPAPVADRRQGRTPAEQLRTDLATFRATGMPFDAAWERAYERVLWPHVKEPRNAWKAILLGDRPKWEAAYERRSAPRSQSTSLLRVAPEREPVAA